MFTSPGDHISVSGPEGTFAVRPLRDVTYLYLLAAGTGFTPMARLIQLALQDPDTIRWELTHDSDQEVEHLIGTSINIYYYSQSFSLVKPRLDKCISLSITQVLFEQSILLVLLISLSNP